MEWTGTNSIVIVSELRKLRGANHTMLPLVIIMDLSVPQANTNQGENDHLSKQATLTNTINYFAESSVI